MGSVREATHMAERIAVTLDHRPVTLMGEPVAVGQQAPDFVVYDEDLTPVVFSSFRGTPCVLLSAMSLDAVVADSKRQRFTEDAVCMNRDVQVLVISMDLPFAQRRWCGSPVSDRARLLSDHRDASFGTAYGLLIKELRLLARAVIVVDAAGIIRYREVVHEITDEPDYGEALNALRGLA